LYLLPLSGRKAKAGYQRGSLETQNRHSSKQRAQISSKGDQSYIGDFDPKRTREEKAGFQCRRAKRKENTRGYSKSG